MRLTKFWFNKSTAKANKLYADTDTLTLLTIVSASYEHMIIMRSKYDRFANRIGVCHSEFRGINRNFVEV